MVRTEEDFRGRLVEGIVKEKPSKEIQEEKGGKPRFKTEKRKFKERMMKPYPSYMRYKFSDSSHRRQKPNNVSKDKQSRKKRYSNLREEGDPNSNYFFKVNTNFNSVGNADNLELSNDRSRVEKKKKSKKGKNNTSVYEKVLVNKTPTPPNTQKPSSGGNKSSLTSMQILGHKSMDLMKKNSAVKNRLNHASHFLN